MFKKLDRSKTGLSDEVLDRIRSCMAQFPQITGAVIYGSRAKGTYRNGSDIDLCLLGGQDLDSATVLQLETQLDDLMLPYTFDLSVYTEIENQKFKDHIDRVGMIVSQL